MPSYQVYISYNVEDSVVVEADSQDEAMQLVENNDNYFDLYVMSRDGGYSIPWDEVTVYDAAEEE